MRLKFALAGVGEPMSLPTMHMLLDATESAILESMSAGQDAESKRTTFLDRLYAPSLDNLTLNGEAYQGPPEGFEAEDVEASFDAFFQAAAG